MMPTFPPSSLKFRTAGFPSVRLQGWPFGRGLPRPPLRLSLLPACPSRERFASAVRALRGPTCIPLCVGSGGSDQAPPFERHFALLDPRGPRSGPGYSVPVHHHLIGPIRPTDMVGRVKVLPSGLVMIFFSVPGFSSGRWSQRATPRVVRRLIRLIYAGWLPHDLIRRGLPLSRVGRTAGLRGSCPEWGRGFPFPFSLSLAGSTAP